MARNRNRSQRALPRLISYLWDFKLTIPGKFLLAGACIAAAMSWMSTDIPIFHLAAGLAALFAVAFAGSLLFRPRLEITGQLPDKAKTGQDVIATLTVTNRSRLPACDLFLGLFGLPASLKELAPRNPISILTGGASATATVGIRPLKRGLYSLPAIRPYSTFPFHLMRTSAGRPKPVKPLLALPDFHPLAGIRLPASQRYQPGGIALTSQVGESPEYIGNREYRPGDPLKRVDFRSWGRLARPVVREYQEEYYCRVALALDTFVAPGRREPPEGFPDLEAAVSLSAAVADALSRGEYIIDIFAAGPELYVFRAGRHTALLENVLEILSCVEASRRNPFETVTPALAEEMGNISSMVCILLDWDESRAQLARSAAEAGCSVKAIIVRDGATSGPIEQAEECADSVSILRPEDVRGGRVEFL